MGFPLRKTIQRPGGTTMAMEIPIYHGSVGHQCPACEMRPWGDDAIIAVAKLLGANQSIQELATGAGMVNDV